MRLKSKQQRTEDPVFSVRLDPDLATQVKTTVIARGVTVRAFVEEALWVKLAERKLKRITTRTRND